MTDTGAASRLAAFDDDFSLLRCSDSRDSEFYPVHTISESPPTHYSPSESPIHSPINESPVGTPEFSSYLRPDTDSDFSQSSPRSQSPNEDSPTAVADSLLYPLLDMESPDDLTRSPDIALEAEDFVGLFQGRERRDSDSDSEDEDPYQFPIFETEQENRPRISLFAQEPQQQKVPARKQPETNEPVHSVSPSWEIDINSFKGKQICVMADVEPPKVEPEETTVADTTETNEPSSQSMDVVSPTAVDSPPTESSTNEEIQPTEAEVSTETEEIEPTSFEETPVDTAAEPDSKEGIEKTTEQMSAAESSNISADVNQTPEVESSEIAEVPPTESVISVPDSTDEDTTAQQSATDIAPTKPAESVAVMSNETEFPSEEVSEEITAAPIETESEVEAQFNEDVVPPGTQGIDAPVTSELQPADSTATPDSQDGQSTELSETPATTEPDSVTPEALTVASENVTELPEAVTAASETVNELPEAVTVAPQTVPDTTEVALEASETPAATDTTAAHDADTEIKIAEEITPSVEVTAETPKSLEKVPALETEETSTPESEDLTKAAVVEPTEELSSPKASEKISDAVSGETETATEDVIPADSSRILAPDAPLAVEVSSPLVTSTLATACESSAPKPVDSEPTNTTNDSLVTHTASSLSTAQSVESSPTLSPATDRAQASPDLKKSAKAKISSFFRRKKTKAEELAEKKVEEERLEAKRIEEERVEAERQAEIEAGMKEFERQMAEADAAAAAAAEEASAAADAAAAAAGDSEEEPMVVPISKKRGEYGFRVLDPEGSAERDRLLLEKKRDAGVVRITAIEEKKEKLEPVAVAAAEKATAAELLAREEEAKVAVIEAEADEAENVMLAAETRAAETEAALAELPDEASEEDRAGLILAAEEAKQAAEDAAKVADEVRQRAEEASAAAAPFREKATALRSTADRSRAAVEAAGIEREISQKAIDLDIAADIAETVAEAAEIEASQKDAEAARCEARALMAEAEGDGASEEDIESLKAAAAAAREAATEARIVTDAARETAGARREDAVLARNLADRAQEESLTAAYFTPAIDDFMAELENIYELYPMAARNRLDSRVPVEEDWLDCHVVTNEDEVNQLRLRSQSPTGKPKEKVQEPKIEIKPEVEIETVDEVETEKQPEPTVEPEEQTNPELDISTETAIPVEPVLEEKSGEEMVESENKSDLDNEKEMTNSSELSSGSDSEVSPVDSSTKPRDMIIIDATPVIAVDTKEEEEERTETIETITFFGTPSPDEPEWKNMMLRPTQQNAKTKTSSAAPTANLTKRAAPHPPVDQQQRRHSLKPVVVVLEERDAAPRSRTELKKTPAPAYTVQLRKTGLWDEKAQAAASAAENKTRDSNGPRDDVAPMVEERAATVSHIATLEVKPDEATESHKAASKAAMSTKIATLRAQFSQPVKSEAPVKRKETPLNNWRIRRTVITDSIANDSAISTGSSDNNSDSHRSSPDNLASPSSADEDKSPTTQRVTLRGRDVSRRDDTSRMRPHSVGALPRYQFDEPARSDSHKKNSISAKNNGRSLSASVENLDEPQTTQRQFKWQVKMPTSETAPQLANGHSEETEYDELAEIRQKSVSLRQAWEAGKLDDTRETSPQDDEDEVKSQVGARNLAAMFEQKPESGEATAKPKLLSSDATRAMKERYQQPDSQAASPAPQNKKPSKWAIDDPRERNATLTKSAERPVYERQRKEAGVFENTPVQLEGVVRESDKMRKAEGGIYENEPKLMEGVVRYSDKQTRAESGVYENQPQVRSDVARYGHNVRSSAESGVFENVPQARLDGIVTASTKLTAVTDSGIFENQPMVLQGVVRASDPEAKSQSGVYENDPQQRLGVVRSCDVYEQPTQSGVFESQPTVRAGVVRYSDAYEQPTESGVFENQPQVLPGVMRGSDDVDARVDGGVYESRPAYREDVERDDDHTFEELEVAVQLGTASKMKSLWAHKEQEEREGHLNDSRTNDYLDDSDIQQGTASLLRQRFQSVEGSSELQSAALNNNSKSYKWQVRDPKKSEVDVDVRSGDTVEDVRHAMFHVRATPS